MTKETKIVLDNRLPLKIEVMVYYTEDDEGFITMIDEEEMRRDFEEELKYLDRMRTEDIEYKTKEERLVGDFKKKFWLF